MDRYDRSQAQESLGGQEDLIDFTSEITLMRILLAAVALAILAGCAGVPTPAEQAQAYRYDGIAGKYEGQWRGLITDPSGKSQSTLVVNLQRDAITGIKYESYGCGGRIKYQRTEGDGSYMYLEQIESGKVKNCDKNSYIKLKPLNDNEIAFGHFDMDGKVQKAGTIHRVQN